MFCKFCGKEIPDEAATCPACGKTLPREKKIGALTIALMAVGVVALCLVLAWVIYFGVTGKVLPDIGQTVAPTEPAPTIHPASGENDIYNKQNYYVSNENALTVSKDVVATLGDFQLDNGMLQILYWNQVYDFLNQYGAYAAYFGLDYTKPLNTQIYDTEKGLTWQQYFLENALNSWQQYSALCNAAKKENFELDEEAQKYLDDLDKTLKEQAEKDKYDSVDAMLQADMGTGVTLEVYKSYVTMYYTANLFFAEKTGSLEASDAEIEAYFKEHEEDLKKNSITKDSGVLYDVRHILVMPTGGKKSEDGKTTVYSEEEWEACRVKAQALLDEWLAGEATEDTFAALAKEKTEDTGSKDNGGLYEWVKKGDMVKPFEEWCLDESREKGNYGLVKTDYGYHIMFFVDAEEGWIRYSRSGVLSDKSTKVLEELTKDGKIETQYEKIALGDVKLG